MRVLGSARTAEKMACSTNFFPSPILAKMVAQVDYVVLAAPVTKNTAGFFDEKVFGAMKPKPGWSTSPPARSC